MTWVKLDDNVMSHPKHLACSPVAFCLWVGGLAYANRHATDGAIPTVALSSLVPSGAWNVTKKEISDAVSRLVAADLWSENSSGWHISNYEKFQEEALRANVEARRLDANRRKAEQRERDKQRKNAAGHSVTPRDHRVTTTRDTPVTTTRDIADARPPLSQPPDPSRPVPTRPAIADATDARVTKMTADQARAALEDEWRKSGKPVDSGLQVLASRSPVFALLEMYPDETQLRSVAAAYLQDDDAWLVKSRHPLAWLAKNSTRYVETKGPTVRANSSYQNRTVTGAELFATGGQ